MKKIYEVYDLQHGYAVTEQMSYKEAIQWINNESEFEDWDMWDVYGIRKVK